MDREFSDSHYETRLDAHEVALAGMKVFGWPAKVG